LARVERERKKEREREREREVESKWIGVFNIFIPTINPYFKSVFLIRYNGWRSFKASLSHDNRVSENAFIIFLSLTLILTLTLTLTLSQFTAS
jgi:hypothetical protein